MAKSNINKERLEEEISKLIETVEDAGSWIRPFKKIMSSGMPLNHSTNVRYKGINVFFLWLKAIENGYQTNNWLTMKQCNKLSGKVLKGESATPIFFFKPLEIEEEQEDGSIEKVFIPMLKTYYVFNIDQTTLKPVIEEDNSIETKSECEEFFKELDFIEILEKNAPYYDLVNDFIGIPKIGFFTSSEEYYATLGHEYIHSTGAKNRLDRFVENETKRDYAYEELIAEIGSMFISSHLNISTEPLQDNSKAYLKSWLKSLKEDKKYLWKAMSEASKAFEYLISYIEKKEDIQEEFSEENIKNKSA